MDRWFIKLNWVGAALGLLAIIVSCRAVSTAAGPAEIDWTGGGDQRVILLTTEPAPCELSGRAVSSALPSARRGELLFSSPFLLGGQAAKYGLSCASCHVNGRGNPAFVFPGISGSAGTADTTHGFFGSLRDDDQFNPIAIPDLSSRRSEKLDRDDGTAVIRFLSAQIADEFDGSAPSDSMLRDLAAFINSLDEAACPGGVRVPLSAVNDLNDAADAVRAATNPALPLKPDREAYSLAARNALGRIHARHPAKSHAQLRTALQALSRDIANGAPTGKIETSIEALRPRLIAAKPQSLYAQEVLAEWIAAETATLKP